MAFQPIQILIQAKDEASKVFDSLKTRIAAIASISIGTAIGNSITAVIGKVREMAQEFVRANVELEATRRAFTAVYKDAGLAEAQIQFLRKTASQAGVSFSSLSDSFRSFSAAATAANIPLATQNELFGAVAKAGATLGLSGQQVSQALNALGQMASKGVVSMEELRQQLGESLPGALSMSAKGLGLTEAELIKLVESGGLAARDLFPALAQSLRSLAGENDTLAAGWERLKSSITQALTAAGDAGGMTVMATAVKGLGVVLGAVMIPLQGLVEILTGMGRTVGAAAAAIGILTDSSTTTAQKLAALKEVGTGLGDSFEQADARMRATAQGFATVVTGADATTASVQGTASAATASSQAAAALSSTWVATGVAMQKAAADAAQAATNAAKHAEAAKAEGEAMVTLARIGGDANAVAAAEAQAAQRTAAALQQVAEQRARQLEILQAELSAKQNLIAGDEAEQKARAQSIKDLQDKIDKLAAESAASTAAADAARLEAVQRQAASDATRDHSSQIVRLTADYAAAVERMREVELQLVKEQATEADLAKAKEAASLAQSRLNDAYHDNAELQRARVAAAQAEAGVTRTLLEAQLELARQAEQRARQSGNEYEVRQAIIRQKEIEIQIAAAEVAASEAVATAKIAQVRAQMDELTATGKMTEAKRLEMEMTIKAAEAELALAKARGQGVQLMEEQLQKMRAGITSVGEYEQSTRQAGETTVNATRKMRDGWSGVGGSIGQASEELRKYQERMAQKYGAPGAGEKGRFEDGRYSSKGEELGKGVIEIGSGGSQFQNAQGWSSDAKGNIMGVMESQAELNQRVARLFGEQNIGNQDAIDAANIKLRLDAAAEHGVSPWAQKYFADLKAEYDRLALKLMGGGNVAKAKDTESEESDEDATASDTSAARRSRSGKSSSSGASGSRTYISNITFGNSTTSLRLADSDSQDALESLLGQLARAKGVAA